MPYQDFKLSARNHYHNGKSNKVVLAFHSIDLLPGLWLLYLFCILSPLMGFDVASLFYSKELNSRIREND